jgi:hypothetical protein
MKYWFLKFFGTDHTLVLLFADISAANGTIKNAKPNWPTSRVVRGVSKKNSVNGARKQTKQKIQTN